MANERPMGLRNDEQKVDENWKKINWSSDEKKETLEFGKLEEFKTLYEVPYNDGDDVVLFGLYKGDHHFMLKNLRNEKVQIIRCSSVSTNVVNDGLVVSELILGLMNEIKKYEMLGLTNGIK